MNEQKEITIPVILLKEKPENKHESIEVTVRGVWSAVKGNMGEREARMFLNTDHQDKSSLCNEMLDAIDIGNMKVVSV